MHERIIVSLFLHRNESYKDLFAVGLGSCKYARYTKPVPFFTSFSELS